MLSILEFISDPLLTDLYEMEMPVWEVTKGKKRFPNWKFSLSSFLRRQARMSTHQHIISFSLSCLPRNHKFSYFPGTSNKTLTWFRPAPLSVLPASFCLVEKHLPFFGDVPEGYIITICVKTLTQKVRTLDLTKMRYVYVGIFMPKISFNLWQIWNTFTHFTVYFYQVIDSRVSQELRLNLQTSPSSLLSILFLYLYSQNTYM